MYATIRRYRTNGETESSSELVRDILEGFVPLVAETVAAYYVVDAGDGVIASISICEDEERVRTYNRVAAEWVKQHLASRIARQEELRSVALEVDDPVQGVLHEGVAEPVYKRGLQLLSVAEVAGLLGMGRSWVYEQIKRGELPGVHLGGSVKVRREDLERYIEAAMAMPAFARGNPNGGDNPYASVSGGTGDPSCVNTYRAPGGKPSSGNAAGGEPGYEELGQHGAGC